MGKKNQPRDLLSRYQSQLAKDNRLKDQLRQWDSKEEKIRAIPKIAKYFYVRARVSQAPPPIIPLPHGSSTTISPKGPSPDSRKGPSPKSAVGKGLRVIEALREKKKEIGALIAQSSEKLASMEVEAVALGVELPPRQTSDDKAGRSLQVMGPRPVPSQMHTQSVQGPRQDFGSRADPGFEHSLAEGQKAIERSARVLQQRDGVIKELEESLRREESILDNEKRGNPSYDFRGWEDSIREAKDSLRRAKDAVSMGDSIDELWVEWEKLKQKILDSQASSTPQTAPELERQVARDTSSRRLRAVPGRDRDEKVEKRRKLMFEFLKQASLKMGTKRKTAIILRRLTHRHQLYDLLDKEEIPMISSSYYQHIENWSDLKEDSQRDDAVANYLVKDMQRNWDRFWNK